MTSDLLDAIPKLPPLDMWTALIIVVTLSLARYLIHRLLAEEVQQCRAKRSGFRCVHLEDHPGSHRDEYGDYWN